MEPARRQVQMHPFEDGLAEVQFVALGAQCPNLFFGIRRLAELNHQALVKCEGDLNITKASVAGKDCVAIKVHNAIHFRAELVNGHFCFTADLIGFRRGKRFKEQRIHLHLEVVLTGLQSHERDTKGCQVIHNLLILGSAKVVTTTRLNKFQLPATLQLTGTGSVALFPLGGSDLEGIHRQLAICDAVEPNVPGQ